MSPHTLYSDYTIKWATLTWEIEQAAVLRHRVFCNEQGLFDAHDRDAIDDVAQVLVAIANHGGWHERIVGTVRIHQDTPGTWWGSRLAVENDFRGFRGLGSTLIKLAVCSANALGCRTFLAQVQKKNEALFQKLNWRSHYETSVNGHPHVMMQADMNEFPPCTQPNSGYVIHNPRSHGYEDELAAHLMFVQQRSPSQRVAHATA